MSTVVQNKFNIYNYINYCLNGKNVLRNSTQIADFLPEIMNDSKENDVFLTVCNLAEGSIKVIHQFPYREYGYNRIMVLVINCVSLFSTIFLNGISVITIRKSSQLKTKVCYFVILLQSIVDLGVAFLGIPLFVYGLMTPFQKIQNCTVIFLAFRFPGVFQLDFNRDFLKFKHQFCDIFLDEDIAKKRGSKKRSVF